MGGIKVEFDWRGLKLPILSIEDILKEIEEEGFSELPPNCIDGEEYEEWLRKDKEELPSMK